MLRVDSESLLSRWVVLLVWHLWNGRYVHLGHSIVLRVEVCLRASIAALIRLGIPVRMGIVLMLTILLLLGLMVLRRLWVGIRHDVVVVSLVVRRSRGEIRGNTSVVMRIAVGLLIRHIGAPKEIFKLSEVV